MHLECDGELNEDEGDISRSALENKRFHILATVIVFALLLTAGIGFAVFYAWAHFRLEYELNHMGSSSYYIYDLQNSSFGLDITGNAPYNAPMPFTVEPWRCYYGYDDIVFGYVDFPSFDAEDLSKPALLNYKSRFIISDTDAFAQYGNDIISSFTNNEVKRFNIFARGLIAVRSIAKLQWRVKYQMVEDFENTLIQSNAHQNNLMQRLLAYVRDNANNSSATSLKLQDWKMMTDGFRLTVQYNNTLPIAVNLGSINADLWLGNVIVSGANVDDFSLKLNSNSAAVDFRIYRIWMILNFAIGRMLNVDLSIKNINVTTTNGSRIGWLDKCFRNVTITLPT